MFPESFGDQFTAQLEPKDQLKSELTATVNASPYLIGTGNVG